MLLNHSGSNKAEWFRTDSGTSYQLSKSKASLSSRVATKQLDEYRENASDCQYCKEEIFVISTSGVCWCEGFQSYEMPPMCRRRDQNHFPPDFNQSMKNKIRFHFDTRFGCMLL